LLHLPFTGLPYPALCLLIASAHASLAGHDAVTFAQLYELFRDQLRVSTSAPVQFMGGGSIGMMKCSKEVLSVVGVSLSMFPHFIYLTNGFGNQSFERLVTARYFVATGPPSASISREFVRYRCAVDREEVKRALDRGKQTALQKWFNKALAQ
jgi:origin recognition complex subunit 4